MKYNERKFAKIALIVDAIVWAIFGIMLIFAYDATLNYEGWTNPLHIRAFGSICFVALIYVIIMIRKNNWEEIRLTFICLISMCIAVMIVEAIVLAAFASTFMAVTVSQMIMDLIINGGKNAFSIFAYIKQRR